MAPDVNSPIQRVQYRRLRGMRLWVLLIISLIIILLILTMGLSYVVADKLVHPARKPILSHGYTENRMIWAEKDKGKAGLRLFQFLHNQGYNLLTFDYRNSGTSQGNTTTVGYYEKEDLLGAIDFIKSKDTKAQIALMGWSQGAATSLMAAPYASSVKLIISDSTFSNLKTYLSKGLPHWSGLPNFPFTPLILNVWVPLLTGIDNLNKVSPINDVSHFNGPILLIHSKADGAIPVENSINIYNRYKGKKNIQLKLFKSADHTLSFIKYPQEYKQVVLNFLKTNHF